jgi:hypothetical protein
MYMPVLLVPWEISGPIREKVEVNFTVEQATKA